MRVRTPITGAVAALLLGSGCFDGHFVGDADRFYFTSNLGRPWTPWTPAQPVARGSRVVIDATDITDRDPSAGATPPLSTPALTDPGNALEGELLATDHVEADAPRAGVVTATFSSDRTADGFTFEVHAVAGIRLHDPVLAYAQANGLLEGVRGAPLVDQDGSLAPSVALSPGAALAVGIDPVDAAGNILGTDTANLRVQTTGALVAAPGQHTLVLGAPTLPGPPGALAVSFDSAVRGVVEVEVVDPANVVVLEIGAIDTPLVAAFVTARLADGRVLRQPPVVWEVSDPLLVQDQAQLGISLTGQPFEPQRTDIVVLQRPSDGDGRTDAEVVARLGALEASILIPLAPRDESLPPAPADVPAGPSCGCDARAAPGDAAFAFVALALLRRRRLFP